MTMGYGSEEGGTIMEMGRRGRKRGGVIKMRRGQGDEDRLWR